MASQTYNLNSWGAKRVFGDNQSQNPAGALLNSGSNRADNSTTGDTWIFLDTNGGILSPWGFKHNQYDNDIEFYGNGTKTVTIHLGSSKVTASAFDGTATNATNDSDGNAINTTYGKKVNIAPEYSASSTYAVNDLVLYQNILYRCKQNISTAEAWNSSHWAQTTISTEIKTLRTLLARAAYLRTS